MATDLFQFPYLRRRKRRDKGDTEVECCRSSSSAPISRSGVSSTIAETTYAIARACETIAVYPHPDKRDTETNLKVIC
jgi:hypothetical protein